jgi:hypothetical protein
MYSSPYDFIIPFLNKEKIVGGDTIITPPPKIISKPIISYDDYIYSKQFVIYDPNHYLWVWNEYNKIPREDNKIYNTLAKYAGSTEPNDIIVFKFSPTIPKDIKDLPSIFSKLEPNNEHLREIEIVEYNMTKDIDGEKVTGKMKAVYFPNIAIFWSNTIYEVMNIIAYVFNVSYEVLLLQIARDTEVTEERCFNRPQPGHFRGIGKFILPDKEKFKTIYKTVSIGPNEHNLYIRYNDKNKIPNMFYENIFYENYYKTAILYKNILKNSNKTPESKLPINISEVHVLLEYMALKQDNRMVDIVKLFNIVNTKYCSKIYIQSKSLDINENNDRPYMFLKTDSSTNSSNVFKGVSALYNTCSLYLGKPVSEGIILNRIDVSYINDIRFVFTISDGTIEYEFIFKFLKEWVLEHYKELLENINIKECVYSLNFNLDNYVIALTGISSSLLIPSLTEADLLNISTLTTLTNIQIKFQTNTSISLSGNMSFDAWTQENLIQFMVNHETPTVAILIKDALPTIHVGMTGEGGIISITNATTLHDTIIMYSIVLGLIKHVTKKHNFVKQSEQSIDNIRNVGKKYKKNLLKILTQLDPTLFGTRMIKKSKRAYSVLCQKHKQRPVPITEAEYNLIKKDLPMSIANIKNQTYNNQRVFLFCPWEKYPFMNYHRFQNQLCIIRCTTKPSNKTQYSYCINELGVDKIVNISNKYENQTITLYNPLLTKGRKCKLPEELKYIILQHNLLKLNIFMSIEQYCNETYKKEPFILRRDEITETYQILTDYQTSKEYILVLQSELNDDYFIFVNELTGKTLFLSDIPQFASFLFRNISKSNAQYAFLNFVSKIVKTNISTIYNESLQYILEHLQQEFKIVYIVNKNIIYGFLYNGIFYMSPRLYWAFSSSTIVEKVQDIIKRVRRKTLKLPSITDFDFVKTLYINYKTNLVEIIEVFNTNIAIEPTQVPPNFNITFKIIMDVDAFFDDLERISLNKRVIYDKNTDKMVLTEQILSNILMVMYVHEIPITHESVKEFIETTVNEKIGLVGDRIDFKQLRNSYQGNMSWCKSKITNEDLQKFFVNLEQFGYIQIVYSKLQEDASLTSKDGELIHKKIITS